MTHFMGATADAFPAERVDLRAAGASATGVDDLGSSPAPSKAPQRSTWGRLKALYH
jgi:hypothetical protein